MATAASPIHLERKVVVQTVLTLLAMGAVAVLNGLNGSELLGSLPAYVQSIVLLVGPTAVTFLGGYIAKHSLRADLEELGKDAGLTPAVEPVVETVQTDFTPEVSIPLEQDTLDAA